MWRKIHSNRDPKDTLWCELRKEFGGWFSKADHVAKATCDRHPKLIFRAMILAMLVSVVLAFTLRQHHIRVSHEPPKKKVNPVGEGFDQILEATSKIRESLKLKQMVDSISAKKHLSIADSTQLDSALTRLQHLNSRY